MQPKHKTCGSCAHWLKNRADFDSPIQYEDPPKDHPDHNNPDAAYDRGLKEDLLFGKCEAIPVGWDRPYTEPAPMAVVVDGSQYFAKLFTRAEFACNQYAVDDEMVTEQLGKCICHYVTHTIFPPIHRMVDGATHVPGRLVEARIPHILCKANHRLIDEVNRDSRN